MTSFLLEIFVANCKIKLAMIKLLILVFFQFFIGSDAELVDEKFVLPSNSQQQSNPELFFGNVSYNLLTCESSKGNFILKNAFTEFLLQKKNPSSKKKILNSNDRVSLLNLPTNFVLSTSTTTKNLGQQVRVNDFDQRQKQKVKCPDNTKISSLKVQERNNNNAIKQSKIGE
ncbi:hypothetical protein RFI_29360 [Reticulomyxa filosa]|uniref:Uncharacterized protein n=1 Tax=Reticulomyxa filosa TaxID=46433 RepID=X6M2C5_RETFI|nr:hypothetical protein RFI_29360 [Reticulomyxa filosa]|eukprot:ETO08029.1 hypothetical protein RFI_29360 [Reticulomyxa filosa]